jgi:hypothetical protein
MNREKRPFDKSVDLHESEWSKADKKEPILGAGSYWFFNVTLPTFIFALVFGYGLDFIFGGLFGSPFQR